MRKNLFLIWSHLMLYRNFLDLTIKNCFTAYICTFLTKLFFTLCVANFVVRLFAIYYRKEILLPNYSRLKAEF